MEPFDEKIPQAEPELNAQIPETAEVPSAAEAPQEIPSAETADVPSEAEAPQEIPSAGTTEVSSADKTPQEDPAGADSPKQTPTQENSEPEPAKDDRSFFNDLMDLLESVIVSIFVVMLTFAYLVCTADVEGTSMVPTLEDHDRLLVNRIDKNYERGDILIIDSDKARLLDGSGNIYERDGLKKRIVKRLIAQGGQQVDIDFTQGIVYVDGEALTEPYINNLTTRDNCAFTYPVTVPEGYIFVLGDNRSVSRDSRDEMVGLIPVENIVGKVILRISPFSSFGKVS